MTKRNKWMFGTISAAAAFLAVAAPVLAQVRGQYCAVAAPNGWAITGEQATRTAFGADLRRADGGAYASYFLVGVAAEMRRSAWYGRHYATPEMGVMATLTKMGAEQVQCAAPVAMSNGLRQMQCRTAALSGLVSYQVQALADGGYVLAIRTAATPHGQWQRFGHEASAVAGALRCNVPFLPAPPEPAGASASSGKAKGKGDSQYSRWLGREHYHDPKTGENHWVEPGRDWVQNGRDGPGYYVRSGNELRKLEPGRSD